MPFLPVYDSCKKGQKEDVLKLLKQNRVDYVAPADYRVDKGIDEILKGFLDKISIDARMSKMGVKNNK